MRIDINLSFLNCCMLLLFSCQGVSDSLGPHGLQHTRPSRPPPSPGVCPSSCPLNQWCHPTISSSVAFSFCLWSFPASISNELAVCIKWPVYWSFSINPSNEYSRLISFRIDWFDLPCCPRDSQESSPAPQLQSINSLVLCLLDGPALTLVMIIGKTIVLGIWTFVGKVMSLIFNRLSRFVIAFLPRSNFLLISWLQ